MLARYTLGLCTALLILPISVASAQFQQEVTYVPAPPTSASFGDAPRIKQQEDETDKEALAKQMDEFHKRLQALEKGQGQSDGTLAGRLEKLEGASKDHSDAIDELDDTFDDYVTSGHGDMTMKLKGRVHLDYWHFPSEGADIDVLEGGDPQDRVQFRRVRFGVSGKVDYNMLYKIEMEFSAGNNPSYRDVYLGWEHLPCFGTVLIGNQKRPYGLDHWNSSIHNVFIERPFIVEALNQDSRRLGIASRNYTEDLRYNWQYGLYHMELTQDSAGWIGDNYQGEVAARFASTWWYDECSGGRGYGHFAVSGSYGQPDGLAGANNALQYRTRPEARTSNRWLDTGRIVGADKAYLAGVEGVLNVGAFQFVGEYQASDVDRLNAIGPHVRFHGGYVQASYFLTGEHIPWDRKTGKIGRVKPFENFFSVCDCDGFVQRGLGAWQVAARYSYADFTDDNIDGGIGQSLTLGLNWLWNPHARLQLNYIIGDIESAATVAGDYQIFGARFMIDF